MPKIAEEWSLLAAWTHLQGIPPFPFYAAYSILCSLQSWRSKVAKHTPTIHAVHHNHSPSSHLVPQSALLLGSTIFRHPRSILGIVRQIGKQIALTDQSTSSELSEELTFQACSEWWFLSVNCSSRLQFSVYQNSRKKYHYKRRTLWVCLDLVLLMLIENRCQLCCSCRSFDFEKLREVTKLITRNLNKIIDVNYYPVETAKRSNMRHRPIGLGVQVRPLNRLQEWPNVPLLCTWVLLTLDIAQRIKLHMQWNSHYLQQVTYTCADALLT